MPEHFEEKKQVTIAPEKLEEMRVEFAEELEKLSAQSVNWKKLLGEDVGERAIEGNKVHRTLGTENLVTKVGQKFNLSEEEIDELKRQFLTEKS